MQVESCSKHAHFAKWKYKNLNDNSRVVWCVHLCVSVCERSNIAFIALKWTEKSYLNCNLCLWITAFMKRENKRARVRVRVRRKINKKNRKGILFCSTIYKHNILLPTWKFENGRKRETARDREGDLHHVQCAYISFRYLCN